MILSRWVCLMCLVLPAMAMAQSSSAQHPAVQDEGHSSAVAEPTEVAKLLEDVELSMAMARDGQYGRLRGRDLERLESAYAHIVATLSEVESLSQLNPQKRQSLALAQSQFDGILKPEDSDRKICKRIASTGTRLGALECLTLAERRARAEASARWSRRPSGDSASRAKGTPAAAESVRAVSGSCVHSLRPPRGWPPR